MPAPKGNKFAVGNNGGRPSVYSEEIANEICDNLSNSSIGIKTLCEMNDHWPACATLFRWIQSNDVFREMYRRAKESQVELLVSEMLEIADDGTNDLMTIVKGNAEYEMENKEVTNRSKLRVDTRKWIAERLLPRVYGSKIDVTTGGEKINRTIIEWGGKQIEV